MTEQSFFWDGLATGDAALAPYTINQFNALIWETLFQRDSTLQSVIEAYLNELAVSGISGGAQILSGAALVNGSFYENSASLSLSIATPVTDSRIDRIVLRKTWVTQEIRLAILAGTENASPTAPSLTQAEGDIWEVSLAQALITTAGVITITDERENSRTALATPTAIVKIETKTADGFSNLFTFENIPQNFTHLKIVGQFRLTGVASLTVVSARFNGDAGTNYHTQGLVGSDATPSAAAAANQSDIDLFFAPGTDADDNHATQAELKINNYRKNDLFKTIFSNRSQISNGVVADFGVGIQGGTWLNTDSITDITLVVNSGNFASNTVVTLYGMT